MGRYTPRMEVKKRNKLLYVAIFAAYAVFTFAFFTIGLQPVRSAETVYAEESTEADSILNIPSISLTAPVMQSTVTDNVLSVPDQIAASYSTSTNKTLIFGHSSTIFKDLNLVKIGEIATYNEKSYQIIDITEKQKNDISMPEILAPASKDTIVLMTCSGELIPNSDGDHTHRLIITAERAEI